jgi:uncharacterized Zn-binding protein involved in type VI secretion
MALVSLVDRDSAGGTIEGGGQTTVRFGGFLLAVLGDRVAGHGLPPHNEAVMVEASTTFLIGGRGVVRQGDLASCGDAATASSTIDVGT